MLRSVGAAITGLGLVCAIASAQAADCPGNPDALGTSRIISVDPTEHPRLGTMQYRETLPLADREVVLTFDDGPLPPFSNRVLAALAAECVKATYFIVGSMARAHPDIVRRIHAAGHTIGTHSQHHPTAFKKIPITQVQAEVEDGISSTAAALGNPKALAPFFRIPGFSRSKFVELYVQERGLMLWSADFPADDWMKISASEIVDRAIRRIEAKGRGILLLHDIQPATAAALPALLRELKARGYRIVHVVPASLEQPKTATAPQEWLLARSRSTWPRVAKTATPETPKHTAMPLQLQGAHYSEAGRQIIDLPPERFTGSESQSKPKTRLAPLGLRGPLILSN